MLIAGVASSFEFNPQPIQSQVQQFEQEFQQLGQDLQAGNLSAAQSDFVTLTSSQQSTFVQPPSNSPIAQAFNQLAQDLQSGNLSAAQQDFATLQQDFQSQGTQGHHHHHHHGGENSQNGGNPISQLFQELGQELQAGNLSAAQQSYSSLVQDFQALGQSSSTSSSSQTSSVGVSVTA